MVVYWDSAANINLNSSDDLSCLLKGADNVVYMAAVALGLRVRVKPVVLLIGAQNANLHHLRV